MRLLHESHHIIRGKDVYVIDLAKNNLPLHQPEFNAVLMGKEVVIDGKKGKVIGIESFKPGIEVGLQHISIMLEKS
jgi:hypothetical protein